MVNIIFWTGVVSLSAAASNKLIFHLKFQR